MSAGRSGEPVSEDEGPADEEPLLTEPDDAIVPDEDSINAVAPTRTILTKEANLTADHRSKIKTLQEESGKKAYRWTVVGQVDYAPQPAWLPGDVRAKLRVTPEQHSALVENGKFQEACDAKYIEEESGTDAGGVRTGAADVQRAAAVMGTLHEKPSVHINKRHLRFPAPIPPPIRVPVRTAYDMYCHDELAIYRRHHNCHNSTESLESYRLLVSLFNDHDHRLWKEKQMKMIREMPRTAVSRSFNRMIFHQTLSALEAGGYRVAGTDEYVNLDQHIGSPNNLPCSIYFETQHFLNFPSRQTSNRSRIKVDVCEGNMLVLAREVEEFKREAPMLLNMACAGSAGGGVASGAGAQEESLFRSSNYYHVYRDSRKQYWPVGAAVYTPKVTFFRGAAGTPTETGNKGEEVGYPFLRNDQVFTAPCIAVAGISHPSLINRNGSSHLNDRDKQDYREKIRLLLRVAALRRHRYLILSSLGCGAFKNPPEDIALLFKEIILEEEFQRPECSITKIWFAIMDDHNAPQAWNPRGNVAPFVDAFGVDDFGGGPHTGKERPVMSNARSRYRRGDSVFVWSGSSNAWCPGNVVAIKETGRFRVSYEIPGKLMRSKEFESDDHPQLRAGTAGGAPTDPPGGSSVLI